MLDFLDLLKQKDLKATPQRICVLKCLSSHTHPNIDELYAMIKKDHPSISLATVYKNIATLVAQNLVVEINSPNQKPRYDIYEREHIHVVCKGCGHVSDIFSAEAKMYEYQSHIEKKVGSPLSALNIVATVSRCAKCN